MSVRRLPRLCALNWAIDTLVGHSTQDTRTHGHTDTHRTLYTHTGTRTHGHRGQTGHMDTRTQTGHTQDTHRTHTGSKLVDTPLPY